MRAIVDNKFLFEFGILSIDEEDELLDSEPEPSRAVVDIREVTMFSEVQNQKGPDDKIFKSITHLSFKSGEQVAIFYPYKLFKELIKRNFDMSITPLPYPEEES